MSTSQTQNTVTLIYNLIVNCFQFTLQKAKTSLIFFLLSKLQSQLNLNTKRMKAAIALSRATECDVKSKDHVINQLQKDLAELKSQLFKEVIIALFFLLPPFMRIFSDFHKVYLNQTENYVN